MSYIGAILLGIIQGITEFLPISSSGHLAVLQTFFGLTDVEGDHLFFSVLLHFGTLIAVFFVYRKELSSMIAELLQMVHIKKAPAEGKENRLPRRMLLLLLVSTLPLFLILPIKDQIEGLYSNTIFIGLALIVTGVLLFLSDRFDRGRKTERNATIGDAIFVGFSQALATVPGLSRSGMTITAGLSRGFDREFAIRFSFLLSIPAVLGANILSLIDAAKAGIDTALIPIYLSGVAAAMIAGYLSIRFLKFISEKSGFSGFSYYCWGFGVITLVLSLIK